MTIKHEKGIISSNGDIFYYSAHWDCWSRLLLRCGREQGYYKEIAIGLTTPNKTKKSSALHLVRSESIRIYKNISRHVDDIYTHVLPHHIYQQMTDQMGIAAANRLIDFDYLSSVDLDKLLRVDRLAPFSEVKLPEPFVGSLISRLKDYPDIYIEPRRKK